MPLEVKSFRKPIEQKTPDLNGSTYSALSECSALALLGKCFIVPWKFIRRKGVGGERFAVASSVLDGNPPWGRERADPGTRQSQPQKLGPTE